LLFSSCSVFFPTFHQNLFFSSFSVFFASGFSSSLRSPSGPFKGEAFRLYETDRPSLQVSAM
jgi:hypothetical protein